MLSFPVLTLGAALLGSGVRTDVATGADVQAAAGIIPIQANLPSEPQANGTLTLYSGVRFRSSRSSLELVYHPRLYGQIPNIGGISRPLLLHQATLESRKTWSRSTQLSLRARGAAGELDYNSLQQFFDPGTGTVAAQLIPIALANASAGWSHNYDRRQTWTLNIGGGFRRPLRDATDSEGVTQPSVIPDSVDAQITLGDTIRVSRRDSLGVDLRSTYVDAVGGFVREDTRHQITFGPMLRYNRQLSPVSSFQLIGGAAVAWRTAVDDVDILPTAQLGHTTVLRSGRRTIRSSANMGVRVFFDQITAQYRTQANATWALSRSLGRDWESGLNFTAATSLTPEPQEPSQYESVVSATLPTSYRLSRSFSLTFGGRFALRAAHWAEWEALEPQPEYSGFLGLRMGIGSSRDNGSWLR